MANTTSNPTTFSETFSYDYPEYYSNATQEEGLCETGDLRGFTKVFLPPFYSLVFVTGLLGNGLVACVLLRFRRQCNLTDMCLLNLALSDLLFVFSLPFWARYAASGSWPWSSSMCRFVTCLFTVGFYGSIGFMVVMTLDRYLLIVHSPSTAAWRSSRLGLIVIGVVWLLSLFASLPNVVFAEVNGTAGPQTCTIEIPKDSPWRSFDFIEMNVLGLVLPLFVMVFCYARIIPTLYKMKTRRKHKAIKLILIVVAAFFLFWTPYHILLFLFMLRQNGHFLDCGLFKRLEMAMKWTETIAFMHCCLNPIIYAFAGEKFCRLVVKMLGGHFAPLLCRRERLDSDRRSSIFSRSSEITSTKII